MTREERRAKILATLHEAMQNPSGRDPKTRIEMEKKLMGDLLVLGLEELLDFAANIEGIAVSLREISENTDVRNR